MSIDTPAADSDRYLQHGNEFVSSVMTSHEWRPGQLIGEDRDGVPPARGCTSFVY